MSKSLNEYKFAEKEVLKFGGVLFSCKEGSVLYYHSKAECSCLVVDRCSCFSSDRSLC